MHRRKLLDETEARRHVTAVALSGVPQAAYARANGLNARSLDHWRRRLTRRSVDFVELLATEGADIAPATPLRVIAGDFAVEVPADFDADHLAAVLRVVAAC
jgi:hypothetical protein